MSLIRVFAAVAAALQHLSRCHRCHTRAQAQPSPPLHRIQFIASNSLILGTAGWLSSPLGAQHCLTSLALGRWVARLREFISGLFTPNTMNFLGVMKAMNVIVVH